MPLVRRALPLLLAIVLCGCFRPPDLGKRLGGAATIDDADYTVGGKAWQRALIYTIPPPRSPFLLRREVVLRDHDASRPLGLYVSMLATIDAEWDGEPLGRGTAIDNFFVLDGRRARPGRHTLLLRATPGAESARVNNFIYGIAIGDYATMTRSRIVAQLFPLAALGVFVVVGAYYFALWLAAGRRRPLLVFALLCFAASLLVVAECYRWIAGYPHQWHIVRLEVISALTFVVALLLPLFFFLDRAIPRPWTWTAITALALAIAAMSGRSFDDGCLFMFVIGIAASAAAMAYAFARKRGDVPSAAGIAFLAAGLLGGGYSFGDRNFFMAFVALIACLLVSLTLQLRQTQLRAARLEIELLKRSLQPHFLMNTLTAALEWIEEEPREGARFLEALAGELRILNEISGAALIPIARELDLCRSHLTIMSYRKGMQFDLVADRVDARDVIPPAIFHTLLENAISHNRYRAGRVVFHLREERANGARAYTLDTPRVVQSAPAAEKEGIGLRYIKTRLEESFPGKWRMDSVATEDLWRTTIVLTA